MSDVCKFKAGNLVFELDVADDRSLFEKVAHLQEVFDHSCGKCKSTNVKFVVRNVDENKYYELKCTDCFAKLAYGCHKKGNSLFPKRKDDAENYLPDGGWLKWDKDQNKAV